MEIIQNRYGLDRTIEKIDTNHLRVMGESQFHRASKNKSNRITMFDFEGGPVLSVGGYITFQKLKCKILEIIPKNPKVGGMAECMLTVKTEY